MLYHPPNLASKRDIRAAAERFAERFRHKGPYYDPPERTRRRQRLIGTRSIGALYPKNLFKSLRQHLEDTHTKRQFRYADARLKFLYPSIDFSREDGKLHNIYSGTPLDPAEAIARELAIVLPRLEARGVEATDSRIEQLLTNRTRPSMPLKRRAKL